MKIAKTLGPKTSVLFTKLHDQDQLVFDLNTAAKLMEVDRAHAVGILHAAAKRGLITPIKRGLYNLGPVRTGKRRFPSYQSIRDRCRQHGRESPIFFSHASALESARFGNATFVRCVRQFIASSCAEEPRRSWGSFRFSPKCTVLWFWPSRSWQQASSICQRS